MKVAVLYICTGKYNQFFKDFYNSAERHLLKGIADLEYFVWTDNMSLTSAENVHLIYRECQGFPKDSLFRFDMFLDIADKLRAFDYVFFFNANQLLLSDVGEEILPKKEGLAAVLHPSFSREWLPAGVYPYERNKDSLAYIARDSKKVFHYFMGSFNGGKTDDFLEMARVCSKNTHEDWEKGIVAMVHDESHLNKYLSEHDCLVIPSTYAYPEEWSTEETRSRVKMMLRDKTKLDPYFNKGRDKSILGKFSLIASALKRLITWYV